SASAVLVMSFLEPMAADSSSRRYRVLRVEKVPQVPAWTREYRYSALVWRDRRQVPPDRELGAGQADGQSSQKQAQRVLQRQGRDPRVSAVEGHDPLGRARQEQGAAGDQQPGEQRA